MNIKNIGVLNYTYFIDKFIDNDIFINNYIGAPVTYVSNGPGREQIVKI